MTNNQLNRQRLEKIKSWRETYSAGSNVMLPAEEAEELARIALAAINGEPFAYIIQDKYERERGVEGHLSRSHVSKYVSQEDINEHEITCIPLYRHAQPAPVVPEEIKRNHETGWYVGPDGKNWSALQANSWNACRAAMLAAAPQSPGSEPTTVPGTWIPVNERLPEAGGDMIVFTDGIVMSGVSYSKKKGFYIQALEYDDDEPVDSVTHWMPLPAAPQEVKP